MPATDILEPVVNKYISISVLFMLLAVTACSSELSKEETKRVQSALRDTLLSSTEIWEVDMEIIKNGIKKIHLTGTYSTTINKEKVNKTRIKGPVHIEVFDSTGAIKTRVNANRTIYYSKKDLFELFGDVDVKSRSGRTLHSEYLKWDQRQNRISTKKFVIVTTKNDSLAGTGFHGTANLSQYTILEPSGEVVID